MIGGVAEWSEASHHAPASVPRLLHWPWPSAAAGALVLTLQPGGRMSV